MTIIDVHSHWGTERGYPLRTESALGLQKQTWNSRPSFHTESQMAEYFREQDVNVILDFGFTKELRVSEAARLHDYALDVQRENSDVILGLWLNMDVRTGSAAVEELERVAASDCFVGVIVSGTSQRCPASDPAWNPLLDACEDLGVPALIVTGQSGRGAGAPGGDGYILDHCHPRHIDAVAAVRPNLQILAGRPAWPWQEELISVMLHKHNVWNELHGWSPRYLSPSLLHEVTRRLRSRIMFGADYPLFTYERLTSDWRSLGLADDVLNGVFFENASSFLAAGRQWPSSRFRKLDEPAAL
jgi:uncharacterized protein